MRPKDLFQQLALILDDSPRNISALIINQLPNGIGLCHGEKLPRAVMVLLSYLQRQREREGERETERERQTDRDRQTGRQAGRQTGRQADRQTDRQTHRHTDRQTHMQADTHRQTQTNRDHNTYPTICDEFTLDQGESREVRQRCELHNLCVADFQTLLQRQLLQPWPSTSRCTKRGGGG